MVRSAPTTSLATLAILLLAGSPAPLRGQTPGPPRFIPYDDPPTLLNAGEVRRSLEELYPEELEERGIGGRVVLWVHLGADGTVVDTRVRDSSGHAALDRAEEEVAKHMLFAPASYRGVPTEVWISQALTFQEGTVAPGGEGAGGITAQTLRLGEGVPPILICRVVSAGTGEPVPGTQVFLHGTEVAGLADARGTVELRAPGAGRWTVVVDIIGYRGERLELELARGTVTQVLAALEPAPRRYDLPLPPPGGTSGPPR